MTAMVIREYCNVSVVYCLGSHDSFEEFDYILFVRLSADSKIKMGFFAVISNHCADYCTGDAALSLVGKRHRAVSERSVEEIAPH